MSLKKKINYSGTKLKEHKASSHRPWKLLPFEEPDVSRISKVAEADQLEDLDDSFDHPLHSTAVDAYGEEHVANESLGHASALRSQNAKSKKVPPSKPSDGDVHQINTTDAEDKPLKENVKALNTTQVQMKKQQPSEKSTSDPSEHVPELCDAYLYSVSVDGPCSVEVWCPKELKRSSRDITELDVVLAEFEKIAANYRQSIESNVCRKAVDGFCSAFKDQITDLIMEVQEFKNMKRKNAKVITNIQKKRQQLFHLREEIIGAEPQLIQLQREYAELQERKSSLKQATDLLTDLKELQQDCLDYREENPKEKITYGTSSLPALLLESRRVLGAEKHFQNINVKLEETLALQRGKLSKKH